MGLNFNPRRGVQLPTSPAGLYQVGGMSLYTNRGIGVISPPVHFNCPPEVTLLTLRAA